MKNIFICFCILHLIKAIIAPGEIYSQKDTTYRHSLRVGVEVSYPVRMIFEPETEQYEATLDFEFSKNWFAVFEAGIMTVDIVRDDFDYYSNGWFFRAGVDFNILGRDEIDDNDLVYFGLRYGYAKQTQEADNIHLFDEYWGSYITSVEKSDFNAHWAELVGGVKTELFRNFFIGWQIRLKFIISDTDDSLMEPYRVGGFGGGGDNVALDFNYSVYYRIPF